MGTFTDPTTNALAERIEISEVATLVVDPQAAILFANQAAAELIGLEKEALLGQALDLPYTVGERREIDMLGAGDVVRRISLATLPIVWSGLDAFQVELHPLLSATPQEGEASPEKSLEPAPAEIGAPVPIEAATIATVATADPVAMAPSEAPLVEPPLTSPPPSSSTSAASARPAPAAVLKPGLVVRVLILEDDPSIGDIQCRMLKTLGYTPVWVKTGEDAINSCRSALATRAPYAASLLDLTISDGMGGRDACKQLCKLDPAMKNIACSGYSDEELNQELLQDGFADVLPKPFRARELGEVLRKNLPADHFLRSS